MENQWFLGVPIFRPIIVGLICQNFGIPKNNFPFGTMENLLFLGVPILQHIMVHSIDMCKLGP